MLIENICGKNPHQNPVTPENDWIDILSIWDNPKFILYIHHDDRVHFILDHGNTQIKSNHSKYLLISDLSGIAIWVRGMISSLVSCSVLNWNLCVTSTFLASVIQIGVVFKYLLFLFFLQGNNDLWVSMAMMKRLIWMWAVVWGML